MEVISAEIQNVADTQPQKRRGRKPVVFLDNKPIDPKYYVNYYHDVIKKKEHSCPYCDRKFACQNNVNRHLKLSNKPCAVKYLQAKLDELGDSDTDSEGIREWADYYHKPHFPNIPDKWLDLFKDEPQPKNDTEWFQAGWLMVNMMLQSEQNRE